MEKPEPLLESNARLWIVGCGNMGGAMLDRWLTSGVSPANILIIDPAPATKPADVLVCDSPDPNAAMPDIVLLAIKPQMLASVAARLAPRLGSGTIVLSILAGASIATLRTHLPGTGAIVRAMPNLPVAIGSGVVAVYGEGRTADHDRLARLLAPLGMVEWLDSEAQFDAVTALSGSGPAFVCRFIDALTAGGTALGLGQAQAARMALATVAGTASLLAARAESPDAMARRVTSPNGTTAAGLAVLDDDGSFAQRVSATLAAAADRAAELAAQAAAND